MEKVGEISRHVLMIDTFKAETCNFVLNSSFNREPMKRFEKSFCACASGLPENKTCCMILDALKSVQLIFREAREKRIAIV